MPVFCNSCGASLGANDRFCAECGQTIQVTAAPIRSSGLSIQALRHPKEDIYFAMGAIAGGLVWLMLIWFVWLFLIPLAIVFWVMERFFVAQLLGNSVKIGSAQYADLHGLVEKHCQTLNMTSRPDVYVLNGNGVVNAVAVKVLQKKHIILYGDLVDLMLASGSLDELSYVVAHELGHHAAGHTSIWKQLLLLPSAAIPFFFYAYSRACELTADRFGMYLVGNKEAAIRGLVALACGSRALMAKTSIDAFKDQERLLLPFFAFLLDFWSTHPRITKRVLELESATHLLARRL